MAKTTVVGANSLTADQIATWSRLQQADAALDSPYFRPEFTQAVAQVRDDVEIAVLEHAGETIGFFPFQRSRSNRGLPVGTQLSDFHGVIARTGYDFNADELIRECGLASFRFDHLPTSQRPFAAFTWQTDVSPYLDLSEGFEAYCEQRRQDGSKRVKKTMRKSRKLQREVGPIRVEVERTSGRALQLLMDWKAEQYRRSNLANLFGFDWIVRLLEHVLDARDPLFEGMMFVLYAGKRVAAIDFTLRSAGVLHSWFPAYEPVLSTYSPGHILLMETARMAETLGIRRIDLGKGPETYKTSFMSGAVTVAEGGVHSRPMDRLLARNWHRLRDWIGSSPLKRPLRKPVRILRSIYTLATLR